ncbi:MAG: hypothetical protein K0S97_66 [Chloroflexota bacterium]|jgi:hypothetical protein|nr:hypothetical protein [Chloroflexota bacterium]
MATTDAKPGFRLPWSADRNESDARAEMTGDAPVGAALPTDQEIEAPDMIDAAPSETDQAAAVDDGPAVDTMSEDSAPVESTAAAEPSPVDTTEASNATRQQPSKFMADLTRAMQGAAETAKADTLARFSADAKAHIESIHAATAIEATELRKQADDDVASIREWSKAEIARIREETDERITHRKARLEREIDAHAADIEGRIERVQRRVDAFEAEMAEFFQRLIAEEDATRFAAMAASLPEPPPWDEMSNGEFATLTETEPANDMYTQIEEALAEQAIAVDPEPDALAEPAEAVGETIDASESTDAAAVDETQPTEAQAEVVAATDDQPTDDAVTGESESEVAGIDPRVAALGLTPDFDAAEAEAAAFNPEEASTEEEIPVIGDDALAARLAGLVPDADTAATEAHTTRVVVTGLVSVASIAGFKRQLSRVAGVQSVGVSSGPDGEFLFAVAHDSGIVLRDAVTTLPGFGARVTAEAEGELTVTAKDPEAEG